MKKEISFDRIGIHNYVKGDIKLEFIVLDLEQATEVQLLNAINANVRTARLVSSEVENLKKASKSARKYPKQHQKNDALASPASSNNESKDQAFEDEVAYYYSSVKASSKEEFRSASR